MARFSTATSISTEQRQKITADVSNLDFILGTREDINGEWHGESYCFQLELETLVGILRVCGYEKTAFSFDVENFLHLKNEEYLNYEDGDFWFLDPRRIKDLIIELQDATDKKLKTKGLKKGITDTHGDPITEENYRSHIFDFGDLKKQMARAVGKNDFLMFCSWKR